MSNNAIETREIIILSDGNPLMISDAVLEKLRGKSAENKAPVTDIKG